ncbi:MAG: tetratricopeptide repeat protein [Vicinamibacterales bacterium]
MPDSSRIDELRRRVLKDPASIAFAQLGEEYRRAGQLADAVDACRIGLTTHPEYVSARVTLGRALLALGRLDEATVELRQVLATAPENLAATRALADALRQQGRLAEALPYYAEALTLAPNDPDLERSITDTRRALAAAAEPSAERARDRATVSALERWLEAIYAARTVRPS